MSLSECVRLHNPPLSLSLFLSAFDTRVSRCGVCMFNINMNKYVIINVLHRIRVKCFSHTIVAHHVIRTIIKCNYYACTYTNIQISPLNAVVMRHMSQFNFNRVVYI